ncbi:FGGY carbohydrate kinase domain-containing protein [Bombus vosnesenskii]|uniref:FGGY carbohydrate kinase domain-containing protein n=2 Tax=Pyrobombus TaxID=144703 RepID=A0A6J3K432_9HYME|nr:FGGY carbohydrate kinase domain-containing protein [Bombus vancouverensis nearcticus]XP_033188982.1 FGGY carbohydrate kinase domain-containing protein [Bombus vancouverensis nearcticus]XP_033188983.1 FGGY carbohydrate kinase domain-containing protein [Bombus vancouverensis nearcticus]XP_033314422.1 FGGY carbohydrate kinase domain-containing protein [Bombus bifarius]XP_033314423.1 FGGY carbohydrate kinase domain-containing protein [Bombus bifarius]XP_033314424.1 FGGY carbohydrate kinase doma
MDYYVGVDVGTGSARAALVSSTGKILKMTTCPLEIFHPAPNFYEQSSDNIWSAVCHVVKSVVADISAEYVRGIGFAATCSLVAIDKTGSPVTVSPTGEDKQNVILWMDHRAQKEADFINEQNHEMLQYVGGKVSLEMQTPKMLWLKNNLPSSWNRAALLFDLPDFLTWKATGSESRSLCSLVCKWNYSAGPDGNNKWVEEFFEQIHLKDLKKDNWRKIGNDVRTPGHRVDQGLSTKAASELGLLKRTAVGTSLIDAHAGGLGMIGCHVPGVSPKLQSRLALICGTSTCHMIVNEKKLFVSGVWGPYFSAMVPGMWLSEGGQSATGKLLDHIIDTHPATPGILKSLGGNKHIQEYLSELLQTIADQKNLENVSYLTKDIHIWPDFHGNRSPLADPALKGMISGLNLSVDHENLALLYLATIQALTYGTKYILETLEAAGHKIETLLVCGGLSQNPLFIQIQADVLGLPVLCPIEKESVLIGAAILGSYAAGSFNTVYDATQTMGGSANIVKPKNECYKYHLQKYRVFRRMVQDQKDYRDIMSKEFL